MMENHLGLDDRRAPVRRAFPARPHREDHRQARRNREALTAARRN